MATAEFAIANAGVEQTGRVAGDQKLLMELIADFVNRFVFLPAPELYVLVASWIIATHTHQRFDWFGYLLAYSPEPQSGKTTVLDVLHCLAYNPTDVQIAPTPATLFRTAHDHTQLLDEVDSWTNNHELKQFLNGGYKQGNGVTRHDHNAGGGFTRKQYQIYAPRALAGIGTTNLDKTTLDRTFAIAMLRQLKAEKRERLRPRKVKPEIAQLKKQIETWVKAEADAVAQVYEAGAFGYLEQFSDRTIDIAEPLAAIVEVMYRADPKLGEMRRALVSAIAITRKEQQKASPDHTILRHLLKLAETDDPIIGSPAELVALCGNLEHIPDVHEVSRALRKFEFSTKNIRKSGEDSPRYRYTLTKAKLQEIVKRWVPDIPVEIPEAVRVVEAEEVALVQSV